MIKIFFDLDGTLIDCSKRNYFAYKKLMKKYGIKPYNFKYYWKLKRSKSFIAPFPHYFSDFEKIIESPEALLIDRPFFYTKKILSVLNDMGASLYLVTYRSNKKLLAKQLQELELISYFKKILSGKSKKGGVKTKAQKIVGYIEKNDNVYVIGDTEDDILAAKEVYANSIAVLSGIRDKEQILNNNPDHLLSDIRGVPDIIADSKSKAKGLK